MDSTKCHFGSTAAQEKNAKDKSPRHNKLPINNNKTYRSVGKGKKKSREIFQLLIKTK